MVATQHLVVAVLTVSVLGYLLVRHYNNCSNKNNIIKTEEVKQVEETFPKKKVLRTEYYYDLNLVSQSWVVLNCCALASETRL